jgi:radical SAM superfamily enzyme YgiQ (UPF0313 family)
MLVNPPWYVFLGMSSSSVPLGLTSLAGVLKAAGHTVAILDADRIGGLYASDADILRHRNAYQQRLADPSDLVWTAIRNQLTAWSPDVVGVHVKTPSWTSGCAVARLVKTVLPHALTVCGGPHVSCRPEDLTPECAFDYGILGEGELALKEFLQAKTTEERRKVPGVIDAQQHSPLVSRHSLIEDLDALPFDGREMLFDVDRYDKLQLGDILTARGCPFPCTYCASRETWTRRVRYRSSQNVMAEVEYLVSRFGLTYIEFSDDTFTVNAQRANEICDLLRRVRPQLRWKCTTRADCLDPDLVANMHASGCRDVSIGVESGSPRILEHIQKGETKEEIANGCRMLRDAGIAFVAFVMIGFPTETEEEAWETLHFAESLGADSLCGSIVTPYPGTELYRWSLEVGKISRHEDWSKFYHQSDCMGLWDLSPQRAQEVIAAWFQEIESYNHRTGRLASRFLKLVRNDPVGAVRRAGSLIGRRLFGV